MNEDVIADLKQFIATTVSQHTANMATKDDIESTKNEILEAIGETMSVNTNSTDTQLQDHEQRIVELEHSAT